MSNLIAPSFLIVFGTLYLIYFRKNSPQSFSIALLVFLNMIVLCLMPLIYPKTIENLSNNYVALGSLMAATSIALSWIIFKKKLHWLSWIALGMPAFYFLVSVPEGQEKISAFSHVQIAGLGVMFPVIIHLLNMFISSISQPSVTPLKTHKHLISIFLGLAVLGFMTIISNFVLGENGIFVLASGIFCSSVLFTSYNLNGQKSFPVFVFVLLGMLVFSQFNEVYGEQLNLNNYQFFSGLLFGISALFVSSFSSSWASESQGFFTRIILLKAVIGPLVFIFFSGFLFFVYEAFGGRMSISASLIGAVFTLPVMNYIFENRAYGGLSIIFGATIMIMPMLEHDKSKAEVVTVSETLETNLQKLKYTDENGALVESNLNDITIAKGAWVLDSESSIIEFKVRGLESVTDGFFKGFKGDLTIGDAYASAAFNIEIPISCISTYNSSRDKNIRKDAIFFDESKFPRIQYSVEALKVENDAYVADGVFTMKGIAAAVKTTFVFSSKGVLNGKDVIILEGRGKLNRSKFGQGSDASIGDEVSFTFKAIFQKA
jgi:polyisoprenoid-binding protein YceI